MPCIKAGPPAAPLAHLWQVIPELDVREERCFAAQPVLRRHRHLRLRLGLQRGRGCRRCLRLGMRAAHAMRLVVVAGGSAAWRPPVAMPPVAMATALRPAVWLPACCRRRSTSMVLLAP